MKKEKKTICNLILIDASGSMGSKANEVIGGLKQLFSDIKNNKRVNHHTIVCDFSGAGDFRVLANVQDKDNLDNSIAEKYSTRGMTALYDAIGNAFSMVPKNVDGVFVSIITDGEENDSKEFKAKDIEKLITKGKNKNWGITFMGTSKEAVLQARELGISAGNTIMYADSERGLSSANKARSSAFVSYTAAMSGSDNTSISTSVNNLFEDSDIVD